jgi:MYXO-CTERM domain-containing protein
MNKHLMAAAIAAAAAFAAPAHATSVALAADGSWNEFDVDAQLAPGGGNGWIDEVYAGDDSALTFTFTIAAGSQGTLTIVDTGFAGDTFKITNGAAFFGTTSPVAAGTSFGPVVFDADEALANPAYSNGVLTLGAGTYSIGGALLQSVDGNLDATSGALRLSVSSIPEPADAALLVAGLAAVAALARRRQSANPI